MKKKMWSPRTLPGYPDIEPFQCWEIDQNWICGKQPKTQYDATGKLPWTLWHAPSGAHFSFHAKREHCQIMATLLNQECDDWSSPVYAHGQIGDVRALFARYEVQRDLYEAERELARAKAKEMAA